MLLNKISSKLYFDYILIQQVYYQRSITLCIDKTTYSINKTLTYFYTTVRNYQTIQTICQVKFWQGVILNCIIVVNGTKDVISSYRLECLIHKGTLAINSRKPKVNTSNVENQIYSAIMQYGRIMHMICHMLKKS